MRIREALSKRTTALALAGVLGTLAAATGVAAAVASKHEIVGAGTLDPSFDAQSKIKPGDVLHIGDPLPVCLGTYAVTGAKGATPGSFDWALIVNPLRGAGGDIYAVAPKPSADGSGFVETVSDRDTATGNQPDGRKWIFDAESGRLLSGQELTQACTRRGSYQGVLNVAVPTGDGSQATAAIPTVTAANNGKRLELPDEQTRVDFSVVMQAGGFAWTAEAYATLSTIQGTVKDQTGVDIALPVSLNGN